MQLLSNKYKLFNYAQMLSFLYTTKNLNLKLNNLPHWLELLSLTNLSPSLLHMWFAQKKHNVSALF